MCMDLLYLAVAFEADLLQQPHYLRCNLILPRSGGQCPFHPALRFTLKLALEKNLTL